MAEMKEEKKEENCHVLTTARRTDEGRGKKNRRKIKYQFNIIIKGEKYNNGCGTDQGNLVYITRALNPNHTISS